MTTRTLASLSTLLILSACASSMTQGDTPEPEPKTTPFRRLVDATEQPTRGRAHCQGDTYSPGHLARPESQWHTTIDARILADFGEGRVRLEQSETSPQGEAKMDFEGMAERYRLVFAGQEYPLPLEDVRDFEHRLFAAFPSAWVGELVRRAQVSVPEGDATRFEFTSSELGKVEVNLDPRGRPIAFEFRSEDALWGSVTNRYDWTYAEDGSFELRHHRRGLLEARLRCSGLSDEMSFDPSPPTAVASSASDTPQPEFSVFELGSGLSAYEYGGLNHRSLVLESSEGLEVFEAPLNSVATQGLLDELAKRHPDRPVRRVYLTHHHPDHAGGVRPFIAQGIPVVTTPGNADFIRAYARADFAARPDTQSSAQKEPLLELVDDEKDFGAVLAIEAGAMLSHTDEYLLFYFPEQRVLFHGDSVIFPEVVVQGEGAMPGAVGVLQVIDASKLEAERIVGAFPLQGAARVVELERLRNAVAVTKAGT